MLATLFALRSKQFGCFALFTMLLAGCEGPVAEKGSVPAEEVVFEAVVMEVAALEWPTIVRSQGSLNADEETVVGAKVAGRVAEVSVDLGDFVTAGEPLVTLDRDDFRLQVEQADAQLEQARSAVGLLANASLETLKAENSPPVRQERALWDEAKRNFKRAADLIKKNAVSQGEYETIMAAERVAEARYAAALNGTREKMALISVRQADLALAQQRLDDSIIVSPLEGYVAQRDVSPGTYLAVGQAVARIVRTNPLRFRGTVPERYAQSLAVGQKVTLKIESVAEPRIAGIVRISPVLDQLSRALTFEADIVNENMELRTGLFAEAEVVINPEATHIIIPERALSEFAGTEKVWKVVDGMVLEQEVMCGMRRDGWREILEGLSEGDQILADASVGRVGRVKPIEG